MKNRNIFCLLLLSTLISCGNTQSTSSVSTPTTAAPIVELVTEEIIEGGNYGGYFIEINNNRLLSNNSSYDCTFESSNSRKEFKITSSRPESITVEKGNNENRDIIFKTHAPGDSIIQIYDADEMLVYRKVLRVRQAYTQETIEDAIYENDKYLGYKYLGNHKMSFTETQPLVGIFSGSDDFESNMKIKFQATYVAYHKDKDVFEFTLETLERDETSTTLLTSFLVSPTADVIYLYYSTDGYLLNMFIAETYKDLYKGYV